MTTIEIVIDGTDCAGKTPLVQKLQELLRNKGLQTANFAPYRVTEVYPLWKDSPVLAARTIVDIMNDFRRQSPHHDVIIWDRGWPTAFINTASQAARALFPKFPDVTVLLLNSVATTVEKVNKYKLDAPWLTDPDTRDRDNLAYHQLPSTIEVPMLTFKPNEDGMFDLDLVAGAIKSHLKENWPSIFQQ